MVIIYGQQYQKLPQKVIFDGGNREHKQQTRMHSNCVVRGAPTYVQNYKKICTPNVHFNIFLAFMYIDALKPQMLSASSIL